MAADVFGSNKVLSGAIKGTTVAMTIGSGGNLAIAGALVQSVQLQYSRQISRIFELGSENMYYNVGNSEGAGSIQSIVGPKSLLNSALKSLTDPCKAPSNNIKFSGGTELCGGTVSGKGNVSVIASGALLQATSLSLNAQDFLMQSGGQLMFASLQM